jgi:hypothetical protein
MAAAVKHNKAGRFTFTEEKFAATQANSVGRVPRASRVISLAASGSDPASLIVDSEEWVFERISACVDCLPRASPMLNYDSETIPAADHPRGIAPTV